MDGYQLCRECKRDGTLRKIPFIFYTATYTDKKDEEFALNLGADRFIVKPMERKRFMETIKEILKIHKKGLLTLSETPVEKKEAVYLKQYSERLINKLEKKLLDLKSEITERKLVEEQLRESEEHFRSVAETANDAIISIDTRGNIVFWNHGAELIFNYSVDEIVGQPLTFIIPERFLESHQKGIKRVISTGKSNYIGRTMEAAGLKKDGSEFPLEISVATWKTGEETFFTGILRDISKRKLAEEALNKAHDDLEVKVVERTEELHIAKEAAETANRAKSDFLANMSHELRTPLNSVIGFSEVLRDQYFGNLNEKQEEYVKDIIDSGKHLLSLINDILDLSKVEADKMELELSPVNIKDLIGSSLVMIKEKAHKHGIGLDLKIPEEMSDLEIQADERKLKQIMINLLSNADKFTTHGGSIRLEANRVSGSELRGTSSEQLGTRNSELATGDFIEISVTDSGIGISPEDQEKIFEEFHQIRSNLPDKTPGTGLGLSLTKRFVEMHKGRIWVESEGEGKGSRFSFTLPIEI